MPDPLAAPTGVLTEEQFIDAYHPIDPPDGEPMWEYAATRRFDIRQVWTVVTGDNGEDLYASPGYHVVNREGYLVTEVPWTTGDEIVCWYRSTRNPWRATYADGETEELMADGADEAREFALDAYEGAPLVSVVEVEGSCDECGTGYDVADREDHCVEDSRCWSCCSDAEGHRTR